jgi:hypothetical protein
MLKSSFAVVIIINCGFAFAEENPRVAVGDSARTVAERKSSTSLPAPARRSARSQANVTPSPAATPAPRSFFSRLFGRRTKPVQRVSPATTPQPVASRPRRPRSGTTAGRQEATSDRAATEAAVESKEPKSDEGTAPQSPAPPKEKSGKGSRAAAKRATPPPDLKTPEGQEKWKYDEARAKAAQDQEVRTLKEKADAAANEEEGRRALRAYNKALFDKMRAIDPTIKERIDAMEAGVMKRLGE